MFIVLPNIQNVWYIFIYNYIKNQKPLKNNIYLLNFQLIS